MKNGRMAFQLAMVGCVVLFCCAYAMAQEVRYNYVPGTDFSKYKTYKWVHIQDAKYPDQILDGQIKQAIDSQLSIKGLAKTDSDTADLYVAYQLAITQETEWNAYGMGGGGGGLRWRGMGMGSATATSSTINIGTLVLDFYDVAAQQQIWLGDATKTLNPSKDPQKNQANLQKAMAKLLKNYPPKVK